MSTTSYEEVFAAAALRERWVRLWRSGVDLRLLGSACVLGGFWLSVYGALHWPESVRMFGTTIAGPKTQLVWTGLLGLLLSIGYGLCVHAPWGWDVALTTIGFLAVNEGMNGAVSGVTTAGIGALLLLGASAGYLLWRRNVAVPVERVNDSRGPLRARRR